MRAHLFCLLAVACAFFISADQAAGTDPVSYRQATALSAAERSDLTRKAERGDWQAAFALALYYAGAAPNIKNREYFLTLASKSGSRESIEALADFYSMPGGIFQMQKAISLRKDLKRKFPNEVDNIDWAEGLAFEYHYRTKEEARQKEVIFLKLAASWGSTKAKAELQRIGVDSTPTAAIFAVNGKAQKQLPIVARGGLAEFTPVRILGKDGVVVSPAYLRQSALPGSGFWTPQTSQLKEVERSLPTFLKKEMQSRPSLRELREVIALEPKYRRQYVGMIMDGRKVIWVNCIPQKSEDGVDPFANWNREIVDVSDGGSSFWGVVYDLEKHSFDKLILNGSA